jgi:hypothetical protein
MPLWSVYGVFDPHRFDWLTASAMWIYMLVGSVALVNLLVAMFSATFSKVWYTPWPNA